MALRNEDEDGNRRAAQRGQCRAPAGLGAEQQMRVQELVAAPPLQRGTLRWVTRGERRYPGLIFNDAGRSIGRSVRLGDGAAVDAWLAAYRGGKKHNTTAAYPRAGKKPARASQDLGRAISLFF